MVYYDFCLNYFLYLHWHFEPKVRKYKPFLKLNAFGLKHCRTN